MEACFRRIAVLRVLKTQIKYHVELCASVDGKAASLQACLNDGKEIIKDLSVRCGQLEESVKVLGWMSTWGGAMSALGGVAISAAGALPNLTDQQKWILTGGGTSMAICGVTLLITANRIRPKPKT